ncbi:class I SAM-dependent methyltransferase [Polyangium aurulentum]|uniref:class I SAM-dependent methyltransferase n=1 Tax=Polyangium aurulentum TaxID=2567896 RepID=UPI0010AE883E|nr:class I SAM-dependent methyltransferase [Polyangium aurulentum]UQA60781.1 class I SAM-dependent methyltransferase [Polyangium aurulentum]
MAQPRDEKTNFDALADTYEGTKVNPLKRHCEEPSFFAAIGDPAGSSVLDLACGDGYYTRMLARAGARRVVGVDVSEAMVARAQATEAEQRLGIEYRVGDVARLPALGVFDLVTSAYLFPYASSEHALLSMCTSAAANLRSGGRLVSVVVSPDLDAERIAALAHYGMSLRAELPLRDGDTMTVTIATPAGPIAMTNHHWTRPAYERALHAAGFGEVAWPSMIVSAEGLATHSADFWQPFLEHPSLAVLTAVRS